MKLEIIGSVKTWLKVKNSCTTRGEVQSSTIAGVRKCQD